ncbi:hypothetical protein [Marinobacter caseinilyticus]|uniref:hypothetical protein n=1 Tax=Marinobacter caseinilyticus TaxID=2692195 RepID=UPI0014078E0C|nr:hypothetical protein [Marinobacter caseinilyticus]
MEAFYAQGARDVIRDSEWVACQVNPNHFDSDSPAVGTLLECVRGKGVRLPIRWEGQANAITVPNPAGIGFEQKISPHTKQNRPFLETRLQRMSSPNPWAHFDDNAFMGAEPYPLDQSCQRPQTLKKNCQHSPPVRVNSPSLQRVCHGIPRNHNPRYCFNPLAISVSTPRGSLGGRTTGYKSPFFQSDRIKGYRIAWKVFLNA